MKKAFILSLVLGIMSLASAATEIVPSLEYEVSGNTLTLIATSPVIGYLLNLKADDGSLLSDSTLNPHFGVASYNYPGQWNNTGYLPNGMLGVSASVGLNPYLTGTIYSVDFASTAQSIKFVYAQY